jgi:hypothetical protein
MISHERSYGIHWTPRLVWRTYPHTGLSILSLWGLGGEPRYS